MSAASHPEPSENQPEAEERALAVWGHCGPNADTVPNGKGPKDRKLHGTPARSTKAHAGVRFSGEMTPRHPVSGVCAPGVAGPLGAIR